jgi:MFS transporter, SHS family, sialic acid transporter
MGANDRGAITSAVPVPPDNGLPAAPPLALPTRGRWLALTAALLGWMFDGLEMGLFPQVARPALRELLGGAGTDAAVAQWFAVITAGFLVGAATGGVLFGWLGDRLGRVRAMTLSVLTYAVFSGLCGVATAAWQVALLRFVAALGMGGEWSLGVALVMEVWQVRSRGLLAGLIGSAANFGYMSVALVGLSLNALLGDVRAGLSGLGLPDALVAWLTGNDGWRLLMLIGATPALLTFLIRLFVPESVRWEQERERGATAHWATRDLLGVLGGAAAALALIYLWAADAPFGVRLVGSLPWLLLIAAGYLYPVVRYLHRSTGPGEVLPTVKLMLLGACLSGVPLLATWGSVQFAPTWADKLANPDGHYRLFPEAKYYAQFWSSLGACVGTVLGAMLGDWIGRRAAYASLCLSAMAATLVFFNVNTAVDARFLLTVFLAGALSASFYGWLPLYLPELFRTRVRATGQGFGFNFGRVLAAVGVLQLTELVKVFDGSYPKAASVLCLIYVLGLGLIWLAPETRGRPLPE